MSNSAGERMDANYKPPRTIIPIPDVGQEYPEVDTPYKIVSSNTIFNEPSKVDFSPKSDNADIINTI